MKHMKIITAITIMVIVLSAAVCITAIIPGEGKSYTIMSQWGEEIEIHGRGLYQRESHSYAVQAIAQDWVTLVTGIPLLVISLLMAVKESYRGRLLLTGTLGYFLYTYMSYAFLMTYNNIFLIYVLLFSLSLFGFILSLIDLDINKIKSHIKPGFPRRSTGIFFIFIGIMLLFMWLARIIPTIGTGTAPVGLESYTTLVIQAMDLGIIVPATLIAATALFLKLNIGYALSTVIVLKGATLFSAVTMMAILMKLNGIEVNPAEFAVFPAATLINYIFCFLILRNIK